MRREGKDRRRRRGGALIELALLLPMLIILLFGTIEFASIFYIRHNMVKAARAGARTLAVQDGTEAQARAAVANNLDDLPNVDFTISVRVPPEGDPSDRDVTVEIEAPLAGAALGDPLRVFGDSTISASVTMRKEG